MMPVLAGVERSLKNVVGGDGLLSFSAFVNIYHQQSDEQFSILSSSQLKIKHIHPIAFARVVGGKHQTTADEFGNTNTGEKIS
jgi:negative regulator of sigma E activity